MGDRTAAGPELKLEKLISEKRLVHSRSVAEYARLLAPRFGEGADRAWYAGLVHDIAKEFSPEAIKELLKEEKDSFAEEDLKTPRLLHGQAGAAYLKKHWDIQDSDILDAVRYHTFGRLAMCPLARLVYIADKLEFLRSSVDPHLRAQSWSLGPEELFRLVVRKTAGYLQQKGELIHRDTLELLKSFDEEAYEINR